MVTDSTLDSKEENPKISNRKGMENTGDSKPEESPSLTSKVTDTSDTTQAEFPLPAVMTWIMIPVAVGLLTIFTMVSWISNKLTLEVENGKKTEKHMSHKQEKTTEIIAKGESDTTVYDTCCCISNHKTDLQTLHENMSNSNENDSSVNCSFQNLTSSDISERNEEMKDDEDGLLQESVLVSKDNFGADELENNTSEQVKALSDSNNNYKQCKIAQNFESMCLSCEVTGEKTKHTVDSSGKNVQPHPINGNVECQSCQSNGHLISVHMGPGFTGNLSISSGSSTDCGDVSTINNEITDNGTESNIDGPEHLLTSKINCIQTTVKSINCDFPANNHPGKRELLCQLPLAAECRPSSDTAVGVEDSVNLGDIKENKIPESDSRTPLSCFPTESTYSQLKDGFKEAATAKVSPSLHYLANCLAPQETADASLSCKNSSEEALIFPLDTDTTKENQTRNCSKEKIDLETPRTRFLRKIRDDPTLSKSLDSQIKSLEKGCKLLEKKPSKSALRSVGSEGCLVKKFVHFPEDIRNFRKVHKYHSFDESWYDFNAGDNTSKSNDQ